MTALLRRSSIKVYADLVTLLQGTLFTLDSWRYSQDGGPQEATLWRHGNTGSMPPCSTRVDCSRCLSLGSRQVLRHQDLYRLSSYGQTGGKISKLTVLSTFHEPRALSKLSAGVLGRGLLTGSEVFGKKSVHLTRRRNFERLWFLM